MRIGAIVLACALVLSAGAPAWSAPPPCERELQAGRECPALIEEARRLVAAFAAREAGRQVGAYHVAGAALVIQDVRTGAIVAAQAFVSPDDPTPPVTVDGLILPLSTTKLFLAASLWDRHRRDGVFDQVVTEMLLHSDDEMGRKLSLQLRKEAGTAAVLADLDRFGMPACGAVSGRDNAFWHEGRAPEHLIPARSCTTLAAVTSDADWASALSLGEQNFSLTLLHLSRFMQAVGNYGVAVTPKYPAVPGVLDDLAPGRTVMVQPEVAAKMRSALLATVQRGTARGVKERMRGGWQIGGKTGTGPATTNPYDGIFLGLAFDPQDKPRYTIAIYVQRGGKGGGAAAEIACDLFNFMLGL